jgi:hypothetical protein
LLGAAFLIFRSGRQEISGELVALESDQVVVIVGGGAEQE